MKFLLLTIFLFGATGALLCPAGSQYNGNFNKCYLLVNTKNSYQLSEEYCNNMGGHLASVQNGYENSYLAEVAQREIGFKFINVWIGANDLSNFPLFEWTDNTNFTYTNWQKGTGMPQISTYYQCVYMLPGSGEWVTNVCHGKEWSICQFRPSNTTQ